MGKIVLVGLCHLRTFFGSYNSSYVFYGTISFIDTVRKSLWNSALFTMKISACWK